MQDNKSPAKVCICRNNRKKLTTTDKARAYLRLEYVKLISNQGNHWHFKVRNHDVFKSLKGWSCSAYGKKTKKNGEIKEYGCIFKINPNCSHIQACKMFLKRLEANYE